MTKFYRIVTDPNAITRWFLKAPRDAMGNEIDARLFTYGIQYTGNEPLTLPLRRDGEQVDFNFGDFGMVVTPAKINELMESQLEIRIQRFPVQVESAGQEYEILNVLEVVKCIDEMKSEFSRWTEDDGLPEKVGKYFTFHKLCISPEAATGHHLFRIEDWEVALIASEKMKNLLNEQGVTGIAFQPI